MDAAGTRGGQRHPRSVTGDKWLEDADGKQEWRNAVPRQVVTSINQGSLLATAKSGEAAAIDMLYRAHAEKLFRTVRRITRNREDAEDAVQDSLLRAFLHRKSFD